MANRSYLYAIENVPGVERPSLPTMRLSEINYQIPLIYKLLVSGDSHASQSCTFDVKQKSAICGNYAAGLEKAHSFLEALPTPELEDKIVSCLTFLNLPSNRRKYFILECAEIFLMEEDSIEALPKHCEKLLLQVQTIDSEVASFMSELRSAIDKNRNNDIKYLVDQVGLDAYWGNTLYYAPK